MKPERLADAWWMTGWECFACNRRIDGRGVIKFGLSGVYCSDECRGKAVVAS